MIFERDIAHISVFPAAPGGGNPCTIVLDASGMDAAEMKAVAAAAGHECAFVFPPEAAGAADYRFRFFVPAHEMEMCGHATLGAAWLLFGRRPETACLRIETLAGPVDAVRGKLGIEISQPAGHAEPADITPVLEALGLTPADLHPDHRILNAATSRAKTLVPLRSLARLNGLAPDMEAVRAACDAIGSTGLYPWAPGNPGVVHARQFPRSSGYLEDPATGIAAAALYYGLGAPQTGLTVLQGEAMGRPSAIHIRPDPEGAGCWLSGAVEPDERENITAGRLQGR
jgi:PhzF family phenazine biosynthesis protein